MSSSNQTISRAQIQSLLQLINNATEGLVSEYENSEDGIPSPLSNIPHSFDNGPPSFTMSKNLRTLEGACGQLLATLSPLAPAWVRVRAVFL